MWQQHFMKKAVALKLLRWHSSTVELLNLQYERHCGRRRFISLRGRCLEGWTLGNKLAAEI